MSIDEPVSTRGTTGAGLYGHVHGRRTTCAQANNPFGHNPECLCGWDRPAPLWLTEKEIDDD